MPFSPRKWTNSQGGHTDEEILWGMWTSHSSSDNNPRTPIYGTPKINPRSNGKKTGITKMIQECRSKYYHAGLAKRIKQWVLKYEDCIKYKRISNNQITPKMINKTENVLGPEDILGIDILPNLPNSAGYQNIVTMIDVFSRHLFAYPTQNVTTKTIGRCIVDVMTRHANLPTQVLSDKGSDKGSEVVAEITQILEIQSSHASTKHARTIEIWKEHTFLSRLL